MYCFLSGFEREILINIGSLESLDTKLHAGYKTDSKCCALSVTVHY